MLQSMGSQRIGYNLVTEQQQWFQPICQILISLLSISANWENTCTEGDTERDPFTSGDVRAACAPALPPARD